MARELLSDSGSIFVQISDENLHRVRCVMDEVFRAENFIGQIVFRTTSSLGGDFIPARANYLLWYARDKTKAKFRPLFRARGFEDDVGGRFSRAILKNGAKHILATDERKDISLLEKSARIYRHDNLTSQSGGEHSSFAIEFEDNSFTPGKGFWKTNPDGIERLKKSERLAAPTTNSLTYVRFLNDFPLTGFSEVWSDTQTGAFTDSKIYVVQTNTKVVERCLLMTTDPGDLVLDPTCGSGTTAFVAEQWGRRWITCDSSRVALALAKHRLMTAEFDFYKLRELNAEDADRNPNGEWIAELDPKGKLTGRKLTLLCKTVPHITLRSIARNTSLDPIFAKYEPMLAGKLESLNREVVKVDAALREKLVQKLIQKHREEGVSSVADADKRRWLLPNTNPGLIKPLAPRKPLKGVTAAQAERYRSTIRKGGWPNWAVPFDVDADWPQPLKDALLSYRSIWQAKMEEVSACIAANAEIEELVDKPELVKGVVRVAGPFTMEGVIAVEEGLDSPIGGAPDELDAFDGEAAVTNAEAHLDKIVRLLNASGVDFPENKNMKFGRLDPISGASLIHAEGEWANGDKRDRRVAVSIGPEVGNVSAMQVEDVIRDANRKGDLIASMQRI
jgi:adenine-specific DNA-methyltransferase